MAAKNIILAISVLMILLAAGCGKDTQTTAPVQTSDTVQSAGTPATVQDTAPSDPNAEYRDLEITPSGDPKCFLSPCDCECYPIPRVPLSAKKTTCGTDCNDIYGIKGCKFTNYQCFKIE